MRINLIGCFCRNSDKAATASVEWVRHDPRPECQFTVPEGV